MTKFLDGLAKIELELSNEKGPFSLFALFLRDGSSGAWDLLVAAEWIESDKYAAMQTVAHRLQSSLERNDILKLSRIVIIDLGNPLLEAVHQALRIEHGRAEIRDSNFFGQDIKHAYLFTSRPVKELALA